MLFSPKKLSIVLGGLLIAMSTGCGALKTGNSEESSADKDEQANRDAKDLEEACAVVDVKAEATINLKGVALLSRSLTDVLGTGKDIDVNSGESLFATYQGNFGKTEGIGAGDTFADTLSSANLMTGYFMALNHVAYNAALQCQAGSSTQCACDTEEAALLMLSRAIPYQNFCGQRKSYVTEFMELCKADYTSAVTALMSSIAFAKRN
jgi:hypothetical protein